MLGFSQDTPPTEKLDRHPDKIKEINFGPELEALFNKREFIYERLNAIDSTDLKPTLEELELIAKLDETVGDQWDAIGGGCSWYCGGGDCTVTASSELMSKSELLNYVAENAFDLQFKNAWTEGVKGNGIGEFLSYSFPAKHPRINEIIVVNGYVKSKAAYKNNSRVKTLAVYYNNKTLAILHLKDIRGKQSFGFSPIGNTRTERYLKETNSWQTKIDSAQGDWVLKFEILEVYEGDKYEDTVISEIYFDGLDVH